MDAYFRYFLLSLYISGIFGQNLTNDALPSTLSLFKLNNPDLNRKDNLIVFNTKQTRCPMLAEVCYLNILLKSSVNLNELLIQSDNPKVAALKTILPCENSISLQTANVKCQNVEDFFVVYSNTTTENYIAYVVLLTTKIVGKANIFLAFGNQTQISPLHQYQYKVIITQPERLIDKIFSVYVWFMQTTISLIMGILIDSKALLKLVKIPIPVIIGFFSQYLIMPLVRV